MGIGARRIARSVRIHGMGVMRSTRAWGRSGGCE